MGTRKVAFRIAVVLVFLLLTLVLHINFCRDAAPKGIGKKENRNIMFTKHQQLKPVTHIAFLKIHKASSSTIQNLFYRYGYNHDLVYVLPANGVEISMTQSVITNKTSLPPPPNKTFDILCNHCLYDRAKFEKVLPNDTIYIGSVRHPFRQFLSSINYYRISSVLKIDDPRPVRKFLQTAIDKRNKKELEYGIDSIRTNNQMAYDYGFPRHVFVEYDEETVSKYIQKLDKELDLVIVTDFFDESIVMLRHLLRWKFKDVIYVTLNKKSSYKPQLLTTDEEERTLHRKWAKIDYALYNHFYEKMKKAIDDRGEIFQKEVTYYRKVRSKIADYCKNRRNNSHDLEIKKTMWNENFIINDKDCKMMTIQARRFLSVIKNKQLNQIEFDWPNLANYHVEHDNKGIGI